MKNPEINKFNLNVGLLTKHKSTIYSNATWHKMEVENASKLDRDVVLRTLMNFVHPLDFIPVCYELKGQTVQFLLKNCGAAIERLCRHNLLVPNPQDPSLPFRIKIILNHAFASDLKINIQNNIVNILNKRFNSETGMLNLEMFYKDPDLTEFCTLSQPKLMFYVLHLSRTDNRANQPKSIKLSHNEIEVLKPLEALFGLKTLTMLDLRNNNIKVIDASNFKDLQITELWLDGNPICDDYDEFTYSKAMKEMIPTLEKLDGVYIQTKGMLPFRRNFLSSTLGHDLVDQFLEHYFNLYDTQSRALLKDMYSKDAMFSLTANYLASQTTSSSAKLTPYKKIARNLKMMSDFSKNDECLFRGNQNIMHVLTSLPATEHDPYTFTVDLISYTDVAAVLVINGIFREAPETLLDTDRLLGFCRTFVLLAVQNNEYTIVNEQMHVYNATSAQAIRSFKQTRIARPTQLQIPPPQNPKEQIIMTTALGSLTGLNTEWATKCLEECNYDLKRSLELFVDLFKLDRIPTVAFRTIPAVEKVKPKGPVASVQSSTSTPASIVSQPVTKNVPIQESVPPTQQPIISLVEEERKSNLTQFPTSTSRMVKKEQNRKREIQPDTCKPNSNITKKGNTTNVTNDKGSVINNRKAEVAVPKAKSDQACRPQKLTALPPSCTVSPFGIFEDYEPFMFPNVVDGKVDTKPVTKPETTNLWPIAYKLEGFHKMFRELRKKCISPNWYLESVPFALDMVTSYSYHIVTYQILLMWYFPRHMPAAREFCKKVQCYITLNEARCVSQRVFDVLTAECECAKGNAMKGMKDLKTLTLIFPNQLDAAKAYLRYVCSSKKLDAQARNFVEWAKLLPGIDKIGLTKLISSFYLGAASLLKYIDDELQEPAVVSSKKGAWDIVCKNYSNSTHRKFRKNISHVHESEIFGDHRPTDQFLHVSFPTEGKQTNRRTRASVSYTIGDGRCCFYLCKWVDPYKFAIVWVVNSLHNMKNPEINRFNFITALHKHKSTIYSNATWHKMEVENASKLDRDVVLRILMNFVHPLDFIPVCYEKDGQTVHFLLKNCGAAIERLCRHNLLVPNPQDASLPFRIKIILNHAFASDLKINIQNNIVNILNKRFNSETGMLNLEMFYKDPDLTEFCTLSQPKLMFYVLHLSRTDNRANQPKSIKLSNNDIEVLKPLEALSGLKTLTMLDLRNNNIKVIDASNFKDLQITELWLDGNPVCDDYDEFTYSKAIKEMIPTLERLDGVYIQTKGMLPFRRNFLSSTLGHDLVDQFLEHYFNLYDSQNRGLLMGMYSKDAMFSLTANYLASQTTSSSAKLAPYKKISRNLKMMSDFSKNDECLFRGSHIMQVLTSLPATEHDPYTFTVDLMSYTEVAAVLVVNGVFREASETLLDTDRLLGFCRTFVLLAEQNNEYTIVNEQMQVYNATSAQAIRSFKQTRIARPQFQIPPPQNPKEQVMMTTALSSLTGLNTEWATKCLEECNYDLKHSLELFVDLFKLDKIPAVAFRTIPAVEKVKPKGPVASVQNSTSTPVSIIPQPVTKNVTVQESVPPTLQPIISLVEEERTINLTQFPTSTNRAVKKEQNRKRAAQPDTCKPNSNITKKGETTNLRNDKGSVINNKKAKVAPPKTKSDQRNQYQELTALPPSCTVSPFGIFEDYEPFMFPKVIDGKVGTKPVTKPELTNLWNIAYKLEGFRSMFRELRKKCISPNWYLESVPFAVDMVKSYSYHIVTYQILLMWYFPRHMPAAREFCKQVQCYITLNGARCVSQRVFDVLAAECECAKGNAMKGMKDLKTLALIFPNQLDAAKAYLRYVCSTKKLDAQARNFVEWAKLLPGIDKVGLTKLVKEFETMFKIKIVTTL